MRRVRLSAWLRTSAPTVSPGYRIVTLEVRRNGRWKRLARRATHSAGEVHWTIGLRPGTHRLRVRYGGRWDLRGATRLLRVRVPAG